MAGTLRDDAERDGRHMSAAGVHHVDLVVSSIERSLPFYRDLLGPLGWHGVSEVEGERGETIWYLCGAGELDRPPRGADASGGVRPLPGRPAPPRARGAVALRGRRARPTGCARRAPRSRAARRSTGTCRATTRCSSTTRTGSSWRSCTSRPRGLKERSGMSTTPPEQPGDRRAHPGPAYGVQRPSDPCARMPIPGNAEFAALVVVEIDPRPDLDHRRTRQYASRG